MCKEGWCVGLGQEGLQEGGENSLKYLKNGWNRKGGRRKKGAARSRGGCLKNGGLEPF